MRNILIFTIISLIIFNCSRRRNKDFSDSSIVESKLKRELSLDILDEIVVKELKSKQLTLLGNVRGNGVENTFFFFSDFHCISCINQELLKISATENKNIFLLANFRSVRELRIILNNFDYNTLIVNSNLPESLVGITDPVYLSFDKDNKLLGVKVPILGDTMNLSEFLDN